MMKKSTLAVAALVAAVCLLGGELRGGERNATGSATPVARENATLFFRTFTPESLVTRRYERKVTVATGWQATFRNTTGAIASTLEIQFKGDVTLTGFAPFPDAAPRGDNRTWVVWGQKLLSGDSVTVHGIGPADRTQILQWRFGEGAYQSGFIPENQDFLLPMPNSANFRLETFEYGGFAPGAPTTDELGGLVAAKSFLRFVNGSWRVDRDSTDVHGWVRLRRQSDVLRSFQRNKNSPLHTGTPRGFCVLDNGKPFLRQILSLSPYKMDNHLFAQLTALKLNVAASALGITPVGFGELLYEDDGHPLDNMMLRDLGKICDSLLTYCNGRDPAEYRMMDSVLTKVNLAFLGAIDTVSFADSLVLTGVRPLSEVAYLRQNAGVTALRLPRVYQPEMSDEGESEFDAESEIPELIASAHNYPNPFNPQTEIQFELMEPAFVTVKVYDILGREVATMLDRELTFETVNEVAFEGSLLSSGTYFYRVVAEGFEAERVSTFTGKMILLK